MLHELPRCAFSGRDVGQAVATFEDLATILVGSRDTDFVVKAIENVDPVSSLVASS